MEISVIQNRIYEVRGHKIMLDYDLAELYEVETKRLNEQVRRNSDRFPDDFMFQLKENEWAMMCRKLQLHQQMQVCHYKL